MTSMVPIDDLSPFHVGKVIEIVGYRKKVYTEAEIDSQSKSIFVGELEGYRQESEERLFIWLKGLGCLRFTQRDDKIMIRVREKK